MTDDANKAGIKADEGEKKQGREHVIYLDSKGNWTCGYGHLLFLGDTVPQAAIDGFFEDDYAQARADLKTLYRLFSLPPMGLTREYVLLNMLFQMGLTKVMRFKRMLVALMDKNWDRAADEMLDSKWHNRDTKERAERLVKIMRTGKIGD